MSVCVSQCFTHRSKFLRIHHLQEGHYLAGRQFLHQGRKTGLRRIPRGSNRLCWQEELPSVAPLVVDLGSHKAIRCVLVRDKY
jgi:hypothetical protein